MLKCENCGNEHLGTYGSGRFCSSKCSHSYSTKEKRKEINKKVSETLLKKNETILFCKFCGKEMIKKNKKIKTCSFSCGGKLKWENQNYRNKITKITKDRCNNNTEKNRLRDIGKKGGFGKKGFTKKGNYYQSNLEKKCFEFLEEENVNFTPHKNIPNSSKISDVYLIEKDLWIEIDGINRVKKQKWLKNQYTNWLDKLDLYMKLKIKFKIVYSFDEFKNIVNDPLA